MLAAVLLCAASAAFGQTVKTVVNFAAAPDASIVTGAALALDGKGNIYGTTVVGGAHGNGCIYRVTPSGKATTLYSFSSTSNGTNSDGTNPHSGLIAGSDGNFYGTTYVGGANGTGTVFQVTPEGGFTVLHTFAALDLGENADGANPVGRLVEGSPGLFYGTTYYGGPEGDGVVYQITTGKQYTRIYAFQDGADGANPPAGVVFGQDQNLYGVTLSGNNQDGTAFKIVPNGAASQFHTIHEFAGGANDISAPNGLTLATDGNLYGTSFGGGTQNFGAIFQLTTGGAVQVKHSFETDTGGGSTNSDGLQPLAPLTLAPDGNLYGVAAYGGQVGSGTVFRISTVGEFTLLYTFLGGQGVAHQFDGFSPQAPLTLSPNGEFYGTTSSGGRDFDGLIFRMNLPLPVATFKAEAGVYIGLHQGVGYFTIDLSPSGTLTGKLIENHATSSFSGALDAFGQYSGNIGREVIPLTMSFSNDGNPATPGDYVMKGFIRGTSVTAFHSAYDHGQTAAEQGVYTMQLPPAGNAASIPAGTGFAAVSVSKAGSVSMAAKLADGTSASFAGPLIGGGANGSNQLICFSESSVEFLAGAADFRSINDVDIRLPLIWTKSPSHGDYYAAGFTTALSCLGWIYQPPKASALPPNFSAGTPNASFFAGGGGLSNGNVTENFDVLSISHLTDAGPNPALKAKLKINRLDGVFSGSFKDPGSKKTLSFGGVLDPSNDGGSGAGYFLGPVTNKVGVSGKVAFTPL